MTTADPNDLPIVESASSPCRHLRNKGMYVYTDGEGTQSHDDDGTTVYWCLKSMTNFGPDEEYVGYTECGNPSRSCHEPI